MSETGAVVRAAVVQAAPVLFDRDASIDKACRLIGEAGRAGAQVVLLPEAFIPAYPRGLGFGMVVGSRSAEGRELWRRYWAQAIEVPGPATAALGEAARDAGVYVGIGVVERESGAGRGTLYCTLLYLGPDGALLGKHRKLKPTGAERLIWGDGDGSTLPVIDSPLGRIGGLICWENMMPLARMQQYAQGVQLYLAPTADARDTWQATVRHIACEGRCFVLAANQYVRLSDYPEDLRHSAELADGPDELCPGGSVVVSPFGEVLAGPLYGESGILYADLDRDEIVRGKLDFDVAGHYARPDVFTLSVDTAVKRSVSEGPGE